MKTKITWIIFLLIITGLAGSSKGICGKNGCHCFAASQGMGSSLSPAVNSTAEEDTGSETLGVSPINLFIFQLN